MTNYSLKMATRLAFGIPFDKTPKDLELTLKILDRKLTLFPHKEWEMPQEIRWDENPFSEPNWAVQYHMLRWLDPLRREAEQGNDEALDFWIETVSSWIENNPVGRAKTSYAWSDFVDAMRTMTLSFALPVLDHRRPEVVPIILKSLSEHGQWLANEKNISRGNHGLQQHQGLLIAGAVLKNDQWVNLALDRCIKMLYEAYDDQGMNEEGSPQYHLMNYNWWNLVKRRFEVVLGKAPEDFQRVLKAPVGLAHATRPDGLLEIIGDTEEYKTRGIDHPAIEYVASKGETGVAPPEKVKVYDAGYIFGRSTWGDYSASFSDATFYSIMFGSQNKIHGHRDGLSVTLFSDGEPLLIDAGKYAYDDEDSMRRYVTSRSAHNTIEINDQPYASETVVELINASIEDNYHSFMLIDKGYSGVVIRRHILISLPNKFMVVRDEVDAPKSVQFTQWWHYGVDVGHRKEIDQKTVYLERNCGPAWLVTSPNEATITLMRGQEGSSQAWYSPTWRKVLPIRASAVRNVGTSTSLTTLIDFSGSEEPPAFLKSASQKTFGASIYFIRRGRQTFTVGFGKQIGAMVEGEVQASNFGRVLTDSERFYR